MQRKHSTRWRENRAISMGSRVGVHQGGTLQGIFIGWTPKPLTEGPTNGLSIWVLNSNMRCKTLMQIGRCYSGGQGLGYLHIRMATLPERLSAPGKAAGRPGRDRPAPGRSAFSPPTAVWDS